MGDKATYRVVYPIEAFDGGLNNKYEPNIIEDNESPDCKNVVFDDRGGVQTRMGMVKFNTAAVGSYAGEGLFTARFNDGTEKMCAFWNGSMFTLTGSTTFTTVPSAQSVFTAGTRVDATMYQNLMYYGNGYSKPYKYNGTEFTRHGIPAPSSTGSISSGTAGANGAATGDVNYVFTYVNSYLVEGDISSATATLTLASTATVSLVSIPVAPQSFGVASRRIYRRDSTTGGAYKRVATISDNTTTSYTDNVATGSLGTSAPTDQGEPPLWQFCIEHQERLWAVSPSNPQYLYYSELGNPFVFKTTNFILISDGDGERITGLSVHANMVVVQKEGSVWLIYMPDTTPGNWARLKSNSKYGGISHYCQADYSNLKLFLGERYGRLTGFYALSGNDTKPNTTNLTVTNVRSDSISDAIEPDVFNFNKTYAHLSCAIEYKNKIWISVPYTTATVNNRVYQFDFQRRNEDPTKGSWVPFTYPVGFAAFTIYGGRLYAQASTANGFVYTLEGATYSDDGTAIDSYFTTKEFFGYKEHLENWKHWRFAYINVETLGAYYMYLTYVQDGDSGGGTTKQISLDPGGTTWGNFQWGNAMWGGGITRKRVTVPLDTARGKRIQFKFSNNNTLNRGFHVYPFATIAYNVAGVR